MEKQHLLEGLFLFIFIISGNYLGELLGCKLRNLMDENMLVKHFMGLITLYITLLITVDKSNDMGYLLLVSAVLYVVFIIISRTTQYINFTIMGILVFAFLIQVYFDRLKNKKTLTTFEKYMLDSMDTINYVIIFILVFLIVIGHLIYIGEQSRSRLEEFKMYYFIVGQKECGNNSYGDYSDPLEYFESLKKTFNIN